MKEKKIPRPKGRGIFAVTDKKVAALLRQPLMNVFTTDLYYFSCFLI